MHALNLLRSLVKSNVDKLEKEIESEKEHIVELFEKAGTPKKYLELVRHELTKEKNLSNCKEKSSHINIRVEKEDST